MAGTDKSRNQELRPAPAVVLVNPQLGENIGTAARASGHHEGQHDLRLHRNAVEVEQRVTGEQHPLERQRQQTDRSETHDGPEQEVAHQGPTEVGFST